MSVNMFSRLLQQSNDFCLSHISRRSATIMQPAFLSVLWSTGTTHLVQPRSPLQLHPQLQQYRSRWTKAKKKRTARYAYRQELKEKGIELTKPPYYFPKDTPVANAISTQEHTIEIQEHDAKVTVELQQRLQIANQTPLLRHHMTGVNMSDRVRKLFDLHNGNQQEVVQAQKKKGMELFQLRPGDTGSSAVQVIALTTRIQQLQTHMTMHKKDKHSKKGMDALYIRRRKTLDYMEREDFESYRRVVKTLGLSRN